jgi:hypothetical protein
METMSDWTGSMRQASNSEHVHSDETAVAEPVRGPAADSGFNVLLRLEGGDRMEAGSFPDAREAHGFAQELIASVNAGESWPRIGERYLRPETIISVDVEPAPRWTGSTGRANTWTGPKSD